MILNDGDTVDLPSHRPGLSVAEVARDVANRLKGDVCLWGVIDDVGVIVPGRQINHIEVHELADDQADDQATDAPADQPAAGQQADPGAPPAVPVQATQAAPAQTGQAAPVDTATTQVPQT